MAADAPVRSLVEAILCPLKPRSDHHVAQLLIRSAMTFSLPFNHGGPTAHNPVRAK